jgi:hypothetical protein
VSVALVALTITWTFLGMRAVMDIGGACATGGPYVPVQSCPQGASVMLSVAIPLLLLASFAGTIAAATIKAPTLLLPMWVLLFGSLGWNFLEYAFRATDGVEIGWLVCGIVFEAMALPAAALLVVAGSSIPGEDTTSRRGRWWLLYAAAGAAGLMAGLWSFRSWS